MRTLVIGGSGFLGSGLRLCLNTQCRVAIKHEGSTKYSYPNGPYYTYHHTKLFEDQLHLDLTRSSSIKKCLAKTKPDAIVHCGGLTDPDFCEAYPNLATKVNVSGTKALLEAFGGKLIYFSTDYVFDGENPPYNEKSQPNPLNHYGKTKLLAEELVLKNPQNLVVRVAGLYGFNNHNDRFLGRLRNQRVVEASSTLYSTPTYLEDIAGSIQDFLKMSGLLHFTGEQSFSRYEFLKKAVKSLGLSTEILPWESRDMIAKRPKNSSLISVHRFKKTLADDALKEITEEMKRENCYSREVYNEIREVLIQKHKAK